MIKRRKKDRCLIRLLYYFIIVLIGVYIVLFLKGNEKVRVFNYLLFFESLNEMLEFVIVLILIED